MVEVVALHQLVGEFGEAHSCFQAVFHAVLGHHVVHRDVLPDVPNEIEEAEVFEPIMVVDHLRCVVACEVQEPLQLRALGRQVVLDDVNIQELALCGLPAGVADHACRATHQSDGGVSSALPVHQKHDGHQVADVQAVRRGIEANVSLHLFLREQFLRAWHDVMQQATPLQFFDQRHATKIVAVTGKASAFQAARCGSL